MKLAILAVGKLDKKLYQPAAFEYEKRLKRFLETESIEVEEGPAPKNRSAGETGHTVSLEGARLMSKLKAGDHVAALCIDGKAFSSVGFANSIESLMQNGTKRLVFVIGGSDGLSDEVIARADTKISFGSMTYPHQLMRVILLEQLYRAMTIINGQTYHK